MLIDIDKLIACAERWSVVLINKGFIFCFLGIFLFKINKKCPSFKGSLKQGGEFKQYKAS